MAWTRLGFTLYVFGIINWCGFIYSVIKAYPINMYIGLVTFLILVYASAFIEED